jgi:hypothetical protein
MVYYHDPGQPFPETKEKCGYWLGVVDNVGDALCYCILTCDPHQVIQRSVVRSVQKDTALNKDAVFPDDDFAPDPTSNDLLVPEAGYDDVSDEGCTVAQTRFNDRIREETEAIMQQSPRLAKKKPPQPTHGPQMPPEVRMSLRNRHSAEVSILAVLRILREHEADTDPV